ncbi:MAG: methylenetetrahydrofolate--tRNA-(uracil(54)-C(5))-methyltransferase (FADH(2)-oxidizing) TrmFO [Desulfovibrio sp.]|nr:methylenetetrahydrofolate--tRNA-(uracil(54)-C(5))-methyltransferase (FADH(2)-oxidizing) TrmFO [Desulfovibrio sp.]
MGIAVVGAGLAGCECALVLARAGIEVTLFEQKPLAHSEAHVSNNFAELVCSNSLRNAQLTSGIGLLKAEMRALGSPFMAAADQTSVPADKALAVDREAFSSVLTQAVRAQAAIKIVCKCVNSLSDPLFTDPDFQAVVLAVGPLASQAFSEDLASYIGAEHCYFYDAIAPIVWTKSLDQKIVFRASRYVEPETGVGDYLNCPMNKEEYTRFYSALLDAQTVPSRDDEKLKHFEGCMPIEALAQRGFNTLAFGPLKPVGFIDPRTNRRPFALLQLRYETKNAESCNLVGCQTRMLQGEQKRVFRLVPGLEKVEF